MFEDQIEEIDTTSEEKTRPTILKEEVKRAIETTKSGKAPVPDEIPVEVLIEEQNLDSITPYSTEYAQQVTCQRNA